MRRPSILAAVALLAGGVLLGWLANPSLAQDRRGDEFGNLKNELVYQRATQSYLWALPLLNKRAMKEGSEGLLTRNCRLGSRDLARLPTAGDGWQFWLCAASVLQLSL
jgi:hypothetical protein